MTKEEAKSKIIDLVKKFHALESSKVKGFNEAATKQGFIQPLFEALGWDFTDTDEVSPEDNTSSGRVDYAFKLHGVSQFYVEAKPFKEDVHDPKHIKQAVSYAYNKGVTWAVLTNFKSVRVFNAQKTEPFISLDCKLYEADFERLWLLSRESLTSGLLNQEAVKWGALPVLIPVEKRLFAQMRVWREQLFNQIFRYNEKLQLKPEQVDDIIQKLFNRLIFIRTAEDRGIEGKGLLALLHQWKTAGAKGKLLDDLRQLFKEYDGYYDSELFDQTLQHLLDNPEIFVENEVIESILLGLYEIPGSMANYNFNDIDADVLGAVYEQYLGHVAEVMKQRAKDAQMKMQLGHAVETYTLTAKKERRKEHGIYYTPKFITDYIVKETVGRFLQENAGYPDKLHNIKILDPACGSGSFLIRAYDELLKYHARELKKPLDKLDQWERLPILTNSIFGVDLDKQAIDFTRLNLLLRSLAHREPLPFLGDNIKQGNSLISGTDEELEKYFGNSLRDKNPFNWEDEFKDIMKNGGFDVVIGNPPWGGDIDNELEYFHDKYPETTKEHTDSFKLFIETSLRLVRTGGLISLIVPNTLLRQRRIKDVRSLLLRNQVLTVIDLGEGIFRGVIAPSCVFVVRKSSPTEKHNVFVADISKLTDEEKRITLSKSAYSGNQIEQRQFLKNSDFSFVHVPHSLVVAVVVLNEFKQFICKDAGINYQRVNIGMQEKGKGDLADRLLYEGARQRSIDRMYWKGSDLDRYWIAENTTRYCRPDFQSFVHQNEVVHLNEAIFKIMPKILLRQTADQIIATLDSRGIWFGRSVIAIVPQYKSKYRIEYLLALLNSKYFRWLYHRLVHETGRVFAQVKLSKINQLPVRTIDFSNSSEKKQHNTLVALVNKMLKLNKELHDLSSYQVDKKEKLKKEIKAADEQIDQLVYQLYGLTPEEIALVEGNRS